MAITRCCDLNFKYLRVVTAEEVRQAFSKLVTLCNAGIFQDNLSINESKRRHNYLKVWRRGVLGFQNPDLLAPDRRETNHMTISAVSVNQAS